MQVPYLVPITNPGTPLEFFERLKDLPRPILFESASGHADLGRYSFLCADPVAIVTGSAADWPIIRDTLRAPIDASQETDSTLPPFQGGWAGWFSYEMGAAFDQMPRVRTDPMRLPDVSLGLYDWVIAWDHQRNGAWLISSGIDANGERDEAHARVRGNSVLDLLERPGTVGASKTSSDRGKLAARIPIEVFGDTDAGLTSDFTANEYESAVSRIIEYILDGDIFQANLSQRFVAPFEGSPLSLYQRLRGQNPAPMAALICHDDLWIASASPERFLQYSPHTRQVETRPIKGTARRSGSDDAREIAALSASEKDIAENVMIVDLLRNDLARVCVPGSVQVPSLCAIDTHPTVHHLVSTVTGTLSPGLDALDLFAAAFPGGSITGAPKLRAMQIIAELEPVTRGVYCGAIAWIGLDGAMDTSIAIRTITCRDGVAIVNAGGGITAQSEPAAEYQETLDKAAALIAAISVTQ